MSKIITIMFALLFSISAMAQTRSVKGTVVDSNGQPLIGVSVSVKGTAKGTTTDVSGNFILSFSQEDKIIEFSYVGYLPQEINPGTRDLLQVILVENVESLDEVVVVGYGAMRKSDLAGATASVGESQIKGSVITNLDQSLQGRVSGVTSMSTSGSPGSSVSIRVRGQSTINSTAEPLYVIDGVIVQSIGQRGADYGLGDALGNGPVSVISPLSTINPSDIISMEVLKDASATAIYGAQGSNGVVLITTKRGQAGRAKVSYDGMFAMQRQTKRLDMMNLREFADFYNDFVSTGQLQESNYYADPSLLGKGTNWQDAIFRTAMQHQHQLSVQGGTDRVKYYVSGSYLDQDGTIIGSNFNRYSFRSNIDAQLAKWLKFGMNITYSSTAEDLKLADSDQGIVNYSLTTPPDIPIYDIDGNYATIVREGYTNPNPIALAMMDKILLNRNNLSGSFFFDVTPFKNITWHTELGYDFSNSKGERFKPTVDLGTWKRQINECGIQKNSGKFWQLKNYVTYANTFCQNHHITAMVGQEMWESRYDYSSIFNTALPSDEVRNPALGTGTPTISSGFGSSAMVSFFTRETYNYADRYLLTYTFRYDGSSNFGPNNRWAPFHSAAVAWRFSNESFFKPLNNVINNGKLRVGWGQTGNANIGGYLWGTTMSRMPTGLGMGYRPANIPNLDVKWEQQEQWNIGLDLGMFNNRLELVVDAYQKRSNDMLMKLQLPSYMGTQGNGSSALAAPYGNYGSIENRGLEISLTGRPFVGDFQWDSNFQISFNKNKLKGLSGTTSGAIVGFGQWTDVVSMSRIGESLFGFYGYVTDGVYQDYDDILNSPKPEKYPANGVFNRYNTVWVGDIKYKDLSGPDGVPDGVIDEYDKTNIGSPLPKFTFGWTNTFRYKNFDLNIFINGSYGNKVFNYMSIKLTQMNTAWSNQLASITDRAQLVPIDASKVYPAGTNWYDDITNVKVANSSTKIPRSSIQNPNNNNRISDRYIEDGSYIRIKNITLGYNFPKQWISKIHIDNLRLYVNIQNLLTFTKYTGYDPEIGANTANENVYGLDNGRYPSPTVYSMGLNLTF